jgi:hypothetical protein
MDFETTPLNVRDQQLAELTAWLAANRAKLDFESMRQRADERRRSP